MSTTVTAGSTRAKSWFWRSGSSSAPGPVFAIRWLYPFSLGTVVQSDVANSFYSPTLTYSALQFLSQFEQIAPALPLHAATNLPGKVLLFHLLQTVTNSPQVMGALIVVIANLAALILFYIVKQLSRRAPWL